MPNNLLLHAENLSGLNYLLNNILKGEFFLNTRLFERKYDNMNTSAYTISAKPIDLIACIAEKVGELKK
jgi:hypothetical protein